MRNIAPGVKYVKKPFNPVNYKLYDKLGRDKLEEYLVAKGHSILHNQEDYNVDLITMRDGFTYFNEVEIKLAWSGDWPTNWAEIRIPSRKKRLVEMYKNDKGVLNFYIFSKDMDRVWRIKDTLMTEDRIRVAKGRNIYKGESFFHIPYQEAELILL